MIRSHTDEDYEALERSVLHLLRAVNLLGQNLRVVSAHVARHMDDEDISDLLAKQDEAEHALNDALSTLEELPRGLRTNRAEQG